MAASPELVLCPFAALLVWPPPCVVAVTVQNSANPTIAPVLISCLHFEGLLWRWGPKHRNSRTAGPQTATDNVADTSRDRSRCGLSIGDAARRSTRGQAPVRRCGSFDL